jgi:subtilase family serine protease
MNQRDDAAVTAVATASRTSLWRVTASVAATAVLAVLPGSSWTGSQALASTAGAPPVTATDDCDSLTTCYTPRQLEAAYGILPLLEHGTDGRGETVVLPELAEPQFPLPASDIRRDRARFESW